MYKANVAKGSHEKRLKLNCKSSHSPQVEQNITARFSKDVFHGIHPIDQWEVQWKRPHTWGDQNLKKKTQDKVEKILKGSLVSFLSPSPSVKIQIMDGKVCWGVKAKHCWALSTNFWKQKVYWHQPAMFCLITSSKLSHQEFEFSLKVKVMELNPSYF